jgi:hypothetical protein
LRPALLKIAIGLFDAAVLAFVGTGCTSQLGSVSRLPQVPAEVKAQLGSTIAVRTPAAPAAFSFDQSSGRLDTTTDGAIDGMRTMLRAGAGDPHGAVVAVALTPVAALIGATCAAVKTVPADTLIRYDGELQHGLAIAAEQFQLREHFLDAVRARLALNPLALRPGTSATPFTPWIIELAIENLRLARAGVGDASFALTLTARVRVCSTGDGTIAYDAPIEFRSGTSLFLDWADDHGRPLRRTADYGYTLIAEQIAKEFFSS